MNYFEQTKLGESRWWSWIAVTWIAFVCWVIFQSILLLPLFIDILASTANVSATANSETANSLPLWFATVATLAVAFIFVPWGDKVRNIFAALAGLAIILCFLSSALSGRGPEEAEMMEFITQKMAASPVAFTLFLLTFPVGLIALFLGQTKIHKRTLRALHTAATRFRWVRTLQGFFLTWAVLGLFAFVANALGFIEIEYVFNSGRFWAFAFVSILFIPLQSATEEIVFRGYFNQGLTHLLRSKWIAFAITSFAFMALHLSNPEALEGSASGTLPIVMSSYFFFGFAMCLIVWIDDGLETAIGIHAGNNCFAAVILNYENSVLPTPSIFLTGSDPVKDAVSTVIVLGILVAIIWFWRGGPKNPVLSTSDDRPSIADA